MEHIGAVSRVRLCSDVERLSLVQEVLIGAAPTSPAMIFCHRGNKSVAPQLHPVTPDQLADIDRRLVPKPLSDVDVERPRFALMFDQRHVQDAVNRGDIAGREFAVKVRHL